VLAEQAVLAEPCVSGEEFAIAAQQDWKKVGAFSRAKLLSLRWRSAVKEGSELPTALGPLRGWPGREPSEQLGQVATATSKAPGIPRLRGIAAFNGMAVLKMVVKPSILKTIEAQPRHGLAIYTDGSLLNHSCLPNVNRLPFPSCLVVRAARDLLPQDELTCAYIEVRAPHFVRQAELESTWGFECGCGRCQLEAKIWAAEPEAEKRARSLWRRFERRRREGACSEQELREMVADAAECTGKVFRRFLQTGAEEDFQGEALVYRAALGCENLEHPELDTHSESARAASALLNLLLGSYWVAPAWELAFGLQEAARHAEALELWLAVRRVNAELQPLSPSHAAAAAEAALAAVASGSERWRELLEEGTARGV
ncbi:SET5, partial [Symbiodinium sp. CCMP2456]